MNDYGSKYYYSRLDDGEKELYNQICEALLRFDRSMSVNIVKGNLFTIDITKLMTAVLFDNPVFFYLNRDRVAIRQTPLALQLVFQYDYGKAEAQQLWEEIGKKVDIFLKDRIKVGMSPLAKQLEVHKYMAGICAAEQPYDKECFSVIGALLRGRCVCEGYAKAYKLICDRLGIASIVVIGEAFRPDGGREPHAWNITRIGKVTAHIDTAWDSRFGISSYDYFNLCDAEIAADHIFDSTQYPKCETNQINYFYKNGLIAADEGQLRELITKKVDKRCFSVKLLFPFSQDRLFEFPFGAGQLRYNAAQNIISFSRAIPM